MKATPRFAIGVVMLIAGLTVTVGVRAEEPMTTASTNWDRVSVHLMDVTRRNNILTVKWAVVNEGDSQAKVWFGLVGDEVSYVLDEESGTKYYVLTDEEGNAIGSANEWISSDLNGIKDDVEPGQTRRYWMKLPAPPPAVTEISIFLNETEPMEYVPITDR